MMQGFVNQNCEAILSIVILDEQYREVYINESETVPLIGMRLLRGYDLRIQTIEGGRCYS